MAKGQVVVLGAGIQGVCTALALHKQKYAVMLIDQAPDCMLRASLVNEGRVHLGLLYASDESSKTSRLMLRAALQFAPLLEGWVGEGIDWASIKSNPLTYIILPNSMHPPEHVLARYEQLDQDYKACFRTASANYLGETPETLWQEAPVPGGLNPDFAAAAVATPEVAIDRMKFREIMRVAIRDADGIEPLYQHRVESVSRAPGGFRVEGTTLDKTRWQRKADLVVNCLWEGRLKIDQHLGIVPQRPWVYRLKYQVLGDLPANLSTLGSFSFVQGPFGDIVTNPHDSSAYLSWYPTCLQGWCTDITTPPSWEDACNGIVDATTAHSIAEPTLEALDVIIPGAGRCRVDQVTAGIIFCWGKTDIDDPDSELHSRHTVGVQAHDGYFSVNTGKFTTAPLFAHQLLDMVQ